jgi:hypothetical protein
MMYDLEDPVSFAKEVASILSPSGIWVFEQSYLPLMVERMAFDTICHEHIEYYGLRQIEWILRDANMRIVDIELNNINGGSFSVTAVRVDSLLPARESKIEQFREREKSSGYQGIDVLYRFAERIVESRNRIISELTKIKASGSSICGLGASTKGNVLLQYANLGINMIDSIGDVNPDKWGCYTPGTWIPIVSEEEILQSHADYFLVLPWHFREFFVQSTKFVGRNLIFPLPTFELLKR